MIDLMKRKKEKIEFTDINWFRIIQLCFGYYFLVQIYAVIQLFVFMNYFDRMTPFQLVFNFLAFACFFILFSNLIPDNYHLKSKKKNGNT